MKKEGGDLSITLHSTLETGLVCASILFVATVLCVSDCKKYTMSNRKKVKERVLNQLEYSCLIFWTEHTTRHHKESNLSFSMALMWRLARKQARHPLFRGPFVTVAHPRGTAAQLHCFSCSFHRSWAYRVYNSFVLSLSRFFSLFPFFSFFSFFSFFFLPFFPFFNESVKVRRALARSSYWTRFYLREMCGGSKRMCGHVVATYML